MVTPFGGFGKPLKQNRSTPFIVEGDKFKQVACGKDHLLAVTTDGRLLAMGNSDHGKLGLANINQQKSDDGRVAGTYRPMAANQKS